MPIMQKGQTPKAGAVIPAKPQQTHNFLLRNVPKTLWDAFQAKATADGRSLRSALIETMRDYVKGRR